VHLDEVDLIAAQHLFALAAKIGWAADEPRSAGQ